MPKKKKIILEEKSWHFSGDLNEVRKQLRKSGKKHSRQKKKASNSSETETSFLHSETARVRWL
jgi:hypothetical protein